MGIPLPALDIQPQQAQNPLDQYAKALSIRGMMNQQQTQQQLAPEQIKAAQLENQQKQNQINDSGIFMKSMIAHKGDMNAALEDSAANGMSGQGYWQHATQILQHQTQQATLTKDQLDNQQKVYDQLDGQLQPFKALSPAEQAMQYPTYRARLVQQAPQLDSALPPPNQPPNAQQIQAFEASLLGGKTSAENAIKQQTATAESTRAQAAMVSATNPTFGKAIRDLNSPDPTVAAGATQYLKSFSAAKAQQEQQTAQAGVAAKTSPEAIAGETRLAAAKAQAVIPAEVNKSLAVQRATQQLLQGPALDQAAERYSATGQMPSGMRGPAIATQIMGRAAQLHPQQSLSANSAEYKANEASYKNVTGTLDTLSAFENTGLKNLKQFTDLAAKIPDTGVPWLNTPVRLLSDKMVGSANMAAVNAARSVALREIARVTNDPKLSGALTDSARGEVEGLSPANATLPQIKRVAQILQQDMANVHSGLAAQKQDIGQRIGIGGQQAAPTQPAQPQFTHFAVNPKTGERKGWDGKQWVTVPAQ